MNVHTCSGHPWEMGLDFCYKCNATLVDGRRVMRARVRAEGRLLNDPRRTFEALLNRTIRQKPVSPSASHIERRADLVCFVTNLAQFLRFGAVTLHSSILFMDTVLSAFTANEKQERLIAFVCVTMAAKLNERCDPPSLEEAEAFFEREFSREHFRHCEELVAQTIGFGLNVVTSLHFVEFFLSVGAVFEEAVPRGQLVQPIATEFEQLCLKLVDLTLPLFQLHKFSALEIALSVIEIAKEKARLVDERPGPLELLTKVSKQDLAQCIEVLNSSLDLSLLQESFTDFPDATDDALTKEERLTSRSSLYTQTGF